MPLDSAQTIQARAQSRAHVHTVEVSARQPYHRPLSDRDKKLISEAYALAYLEGHIHGLEQVLSKPLSYVELAREYRLPA